METAKDLISGKFFMANSLKALMTDADYEKSPLKFTLSGLAINNPGGFLLSRVVPSAVRLAPGGRTSMTKSTDRS